MIDASAATSLGSLIASGAGGADQLIAPNGPSTLLGGAANDSLTGGSAADSLAGESGGDSLVPLGGNDIVDGGADVDTLKQDEPAFEGFSADQTLTNTQFTGLSTDTLSAIERASLVAGAGRDIDASAWTGGSVSLSAGTLVEGGSGSDELTGTQVAQTTDSDQVLTDSSLTGKGNDTLLGGNFDRASLFGGASANDIDASAFTGGFLRLEGGGEGDTLTGAPNNGSGDTLIGDGGSDRVIASRNDGSITITDSSIQGTGSDVLTSIENVSLTAGSAANNINASAFSGSVTLLGLNGNDSLTGTSQNDSLDAGGGTDRLVRVASASMTLTGSELAVASADTDVIAGFDEASLQGGAGPNRLDASGFGFPVTLDGDGGDDTLLGGSGNDRLDGDTGTDRVIQASNAAHADAHEHLAQRPRSRHAGQHRHRLADGWRGRQPDRCFDLQRPGQPHRPRRRRHPARRHGCRRRSDSMAARRATAFSPAMATTQCSRAPATTSLTAARVTTCSPARPTPTRFRATRTSTSVSGGTGDDELSGGFTVNVADSVDGGSGADTLTGTATGSRTRSPTERCKRRRRRLGT